MRPNPFQKMQVDGDRLIIDRGALPREIHTFATAEEAAARSAIIDEAFSWIGTPFRNCANIKGPKGAVDCAMFAATVFINVGRLAPFDPRPYSPAALLHSSEEIGLQWIRDRLGAKEIETPRPGDVAIWQFGRIFFHYGIVINLFEIIHAFRPAGMVTLARMNEPFLMYIRGDHRRPVKFFDVWSA